MRMNAFLSLFGEQTHNGGGVSVVIYPTELTSRSAPHLPLYSQDYTGPLDNPRSSPHLKILNLIPSAKSLLSYVVT